MTRLFAILFLTISASAQAASPNVILIMTDDQGYGDFGATGNPVISTPHLDALAAQGVWMKTFYVSPVCSPTRASLMTGRYNYRTRVVDTYLGRSMMEPGEVTIAEVLRAAGYATGIFGKWHLGDCYPTRAMDQGFEESLVLRAGGFGQPSDPPARAGHYTDPMLVHNGVLEAATGYCTDVFFTAAMAWMKGAHAAGRPFFVYLAPNAPHDPFHDVPEALRQAYAQKDVTQLRVPPPGLNAPRGPGTDALERIAAMITNVDENVGRLLAALDAAGLGENTLVIFLVDNGPNTARYVGPFRGAKSDVYEGGVRSPFWMRWPGRLKAGTAREEVVAHIDVMPTILEACGVKAPEGARLDGRSFWGLATGESDSWPSRGLVIQTHRGDVPAWRHHFMIRDGDWKLVRASGFGRESPGGEPRLELYQVAADPGELSDLAAAEPGRVTRLLAEYDAWFEDVSTTRPDNFTPPRIQLGTAFENPVTLTRQDWRGGTWADEAIGRWLVRVEAGRYEVRATFTAREAAGTVELRVGAVVAQVGIGPGADSCLFDAVELAAGDAELEVTIRHGEKIRGAYQVEVLKK